MSWEQIIDEIWSVPAGLRACWEQNRKKLLDYCKTCYPDWSRDTQAALNLLDSSLHSLSLIWVEPSRVQPATLAGYRPEAPEPRQHQGIVDVQPKAPGPPEPRKKTHAEAMDEIRAERQRKAQEKTARETALAEKEERQRKFRDLVAEAASIRPF